MSDREQTLEKLRSVHDFPGPYLFKVIGPNASEFVASVVQSIVNVVGADVTPSVDTRESSAGNHLSVSVTIEVQNAEQVLDIYDILSSLEGAKFVF